MIITILEWEQISEWTKTTTFGLYFPSFFFLVMLEHGVIIKKWRRHLSIVDTGNCEASFRSGCQPLFVLAGCFLLSYSSLFREPTLQLFFVLTQLVSFFTLNSYLLNILLHHILVAYHGKI